MKKFIKTDKDKQALIDLIKKNDKPITVTIEQGIVGKRSTAQNRLQRLWFAEIASSPKADMTAEEYRAFCKLHFGVPILRHEYEKFCKVYDEKVKWRSYQDKLAFMAEPFDFPVTRLMTTKQHKKYLDAIYVHFTGQGFELTDPADLRWCDEIWSKKNELE